ncbi:MAG: hypothetical protein PGN15_00180 [Aeromicrobium erythreum]
MAKRSTTKVIRTFGAVPRKRSPSTTDRRPGEPCCDVGGMAGSRDSEYSAATNSTTSTT